MEAYLFITLGILSKLFTFHMALWNINGCICLSSFTRCIHLRRYQLSHHIRPL